MHITNMIYWLQSFNIQSFMAYHLDDFAMSSVTAHTRSVAQLLRSTPSQASRAQYQPYL